MTSNGWLALSKRANDYRRLGGAENYDDDPASHYSWDSRVNHHDEIQPGDFIVLWDADTLLGVSVIESIDDWRDVKAVGSCPNCKKASYEPRKTMTPKYRCASCGATFPKLKFETVPVTKYRSQHSEGWVDLHGLLDAPTLRSLCVSPKAQDSFRRLNVETFRAAISGTTEAEVFRIFDNVSSQIKGGHKEQVVRVRVGQAAFRAHLLKKYGEVCAFTGPTPKVVLDACHLYKYAELSVHEDEGGLLLRRDLHSLFDQGLMTVDSNSVICVGDVVRAYEAYGLLHGRSLCVDLTAKQKAWLTDHWSQWHI